MINPNEQHTVPKPKGTQFRGKYDAPKIPPKPQLNVISQFYLNAPNNNNSEYEMEAKFGTRGIKPIQKMDYDNVVKKLKSLKYISSNEKGVYTLKIQTEFLDAKTGVFKTSNDFDRFRVDISGLTAIQEYCRTNSLNTLIAGHSSNINLLRKIDAKNSEDEPIGSADFDDFNFRVTLKNEEKISKLGKISQEVFEKWNNSKKVFRYMNRVTFVHNSLPFKVDLSIVRSSTKQDKGLMIKSYTIEESNVFNNSEIYEIEVEVLSDAKIVYKTADELSIGLQSVVKDVLCGLQKTNYPISYPEQKEILQNYHKLLFENDYKERGETYVVKDRIYPSDFIGPSLVTLDIQNIGPLNPNVVIPNITEPEAYCVTEKADGERNLLYVNKSGKIYLINMNMTVIFTGAKTTQEACFNALLDGELILHNKKKDYINKFAAFDIYYENGLDVRHIPFVEVASKDEKYFEYGCRLQKLKEFIKYLKPMNILVKNDTSMQSLIAKYKNKGQTNSPITIVSKEFYPSFGTPYGNEKILVTNNIFEANNYLLRRIADNLYEYEIDGLIFTPTLLGVGGNKIFEAGPKKKITWPYLFKWKPSEATKTFPQSYNTIDFLVVTKKGGNGADIVTPIFEDGINNYESTQFNQFKTLILCVGFDPSKHGYVNPCQDVLDDKFSSLKDIDNEVGYKPKQFFPSNPYNPMAGLCNIALESDANGTYQMFTEERQVFDDQTVVEFRYDMSKPGMWKWIPMRVRYDKTADFKSNISIGANDYKTADNNWHSIHNPVTELMIATGEQIPGIEISDDVYYNSVTNDKISQRMRDFHNLYVKRALIHGVSKKGNNLIDFACGKAGDLPKWIGADLSFVFGIDYSKDNIENRLDGACARYLNFKKTNKNMLYALFVNGNSSENIRSGQSMLNDKAIEIAKSIFGISGVNKSLGPAVERQHGKGYNGFDISSCQFALHYMFENKKTFYNFIRNVAECTKLNGYFIATCYDGISMFNLLKNKQAGESKSIYVNEKKVWSVTKLYDAVTFDNNESCLGYKIDVYQDSINQTLSEYLVNFDLLTSTMDKYGFTLVTKEESKHMGLPNGSGMFSELYNSMMHEIKQNPTKENDYKEADNMTQNEKDVSFLNRFFVYKKTSTRNAEKLTKMLLDQLPDTIEFEEKGTLLAQEAVKRAEEIVKPKVTKLRDKLRLQEATEALEETIQVTKQSNPKTKNAKEIVQLVEEGDEVLIVPAKKKTTRKNKAVVFDIS